MKTLLIDFGASRVKAALWTDGDIRGPTFEVPSPVPLVGADGSVESLAEGYWQALEQAAKALARSNHDLDALWICSEMHGAVITPITGEGHSASYISWRDERAVRPWRGEASTLALSPIDAVWFRSVTGMSPRPGLPVFTLAHLVRAGVLAECSRLFTLVDWLLWRGGAPDPGVHLSLAAGTGLYDLQSGRWSADLLRICGLTPGRILLPRVVPAGGSLGQIKLLGRSIPVYGGFGDLQAAAAGADFPAAAPLLINLGTGSQLLASAPDLPAELERRPAVSGDLFGAISHIPSGRALNVFANLLDQAGHTAGGVPFFWRLFADLRPEEVLRAPATFDLNVFASAWRYREGGTITGIHEAGITLHEFMASLARSWLGQYAEAASIVDPRSRLRQFRLSGGLARRCSFVLPVLQHLLKRSGSLAETVFGDETLDGLLASALAYGQISASNQQ